VPAAQETPPGIAVVEIEECVEGFADILGEALGLNLVALLCRRIADAAARPPAIWQSPTAARASTVTIIEHFEHREADDEGDDNDRLHPGFGVPQKQAPTEQNEVEDCQRDVEVARYHLSDSIAQKQVDA